MLIKLRTYMVMSRDQNAGRSLNIKTDNSAFERAEEFKYFGTTYTYRNSMEDEIKCRWESEFVCYHSVQNLLPSSLLSKNIRLRYSELQFCLSFMGGKNGC